ncbi:hypothetical protein RchiOBHm_Chr4g0441191 [Rosa chinensis]|uniref:Uncharacterized protein n=1 Tax=Rosa chinensis TaxID=74649 RepID=A0A2P6R3B2_ROSCH|nr:hypothetical protein RchiOBHm_Chr4g0441191 [Rosa chinensis]
MSGVNEQIAWLFDLIWIHNVKFEYCISRLGLGDKQLCLRRLYKECFHVNI